MDTPTDQNPTDLTPAEQAAAHELGNICWHTGPSTDPASLCGECDNAARAVVAAARPHLYREAAERFRVALDGVTACTGCGQCVYCQRKAADDAP